MIPSLYGSHLVITPKKYPKKNTAKYSTGIKSAQIILKYRISISDKSTRKQSKEYDIDLVGFPTT